MRDSPPSSPPSFLEEDAPLCPSCGYDLRGTAAERCSECGQLIDWDALKSSAFPWARRKEIGCVRAYIQTIWLVTIDSKRLRHEASKPQQWRDGRSFRWITTCILAAVFISAVSPTLLAPEVWASQWSARIFMSPLNRFLGVPSWLGDFVVPWSAGMTFRPLPPMLLVGLAIYLTSAQQRLFRVRDTSPAHQRRLSAVAQYTLGPLAWVALAGFCFALAFHAWLWLSAWYGSRPCYPWDGLITAILTLAIATTAAPAAAWLMRCLPHGRKGGLVLLARLLSWALAVLLVLTLLFTGWAFSRGHVDREMLDLPWRVALGGTGVAVLIFLARTVQWAMRVRHGGLEQGLLALLRLLGLWLMGIIIVLGFLPWCVGFFAIVIDLR